jgi:ribosomal protein L40E
MRTIWARELVLDKAQQQQQQSKPQQSSTAAESKETKKVPPEKELADFQKRISEKQVVKMAVGTEDYLMDSIQQEFADAMIHNFADLVPVITEWQEQSSRLEAAAAEDEETAVPTTTPQPPPVSEQSSSTRSMLEAHKLNTMVKEEAVVEDSEKGEPENLLDKSKFCVFCGAKIPFDAVYCSSCGNKQPQIQ